MIFCKNISKVVFWVLYCFNEVGFDVYFVGGVVCDFLFGGYLKDFDVVINVMLDEVKKFFCNCWLIGCCFCLVYVVFGFEIIEVVIFCGIGEEDGEGDCYIVDGCIVCDNVWGMIEEDVVCCDFCVNVFYYDIGDFLVCDYVGGM